MAVTISFGRFSIGLLVPGIRESLDETYAAVGLLASINLAGYVAGLLAIPRLARRTSHVRLVAWGLLIATLGMLIAAAAQELAVLAAGVALTGVASAFGWISGAAATIEVSSEDNRGRTLGIIGTANGAGIIVAAVLAEVAVRSGVTGGWRAVWVCQAALGAASCVLAFRTPSPRPAGVTTPRAPLRGLMLMTLGYALFGLGVAWFTTWYIAGATSRASMNGSLAWLALGMGALAGGLVLGRAGDRWGHGLVLGGNQLVACLAALVMAASGTHPTLVVVAGFLFGSVMSGAGSLVPTILATTIAAPRVGEAFTGLTLVFAAAQVLAPPAGGAVLDHVPHGFAVLFTACAVVFLLSGAAFLAHSSPHPGERTARTTSGLS
nr:MFS transporter [Nocardioides zeae]